MKHKSATINYPLLGLMALAVVVVVVGFFQLRGAIYGPFTLPQKIAGPSQAELLAQLQVRDTDQDGLSDFDEQYNYQTSIYLADSDSDGFSDKEETEAGSNPMDSGSTPNNKISVSQGSSLEQEFGSTEAESAEKEVSVAEIRDLLIKQGGLDKEIVDKIDDKTLLELYNKTIEETGINPQFLTIEQSETQTAADTLTAQQIRQLLIQNGMDEKLLNQIDDETLKKIFLETLEQQTGQ